MKRLRRRATRRLLRLAGSIAGSLLSLLGTGCGGSPAEPTYGVPGFAVQVDGQTRSSADSLPAAGIAVTAYRLLDGDTTRVDGDTSSVPDGSYHLEYWEDWDTVPEGYALLVTAVDADSSESGSFGSVDTLLPVTDAMRTDQLVELELDLHLPPD